MNQAAYWESRYQENATLAGASCLHTAEPFLRWLYRAMASSVTRLTGDRPPGRVLDIGSGTGEWIAFWQRRGATAVAGCDLAETTVRRLRLHFPDARVVQSDISLAPPFADHFDTISAVNVLQHVTDDDAYLSALRNLRAMGDVGTRLVILDALAMGRAGDATGVSRVRSVDFLRRAGDQTGWRIVTCRPAIWLFNGTVETRPRGVVRLARLYWAGIDRLTRRGSVGTVLGACLYFLDRALSRAPWGPTTKAVLAEAV